VNTSLHINSSDKKFDCSQFNAFEKSGVIHGSYVCQTNDFEDGKDLSSMSTRLDTAFVGHFALVWVVLAGLVVVF
jgi:hypothetical protein